MNIRELIETDEFKDIVLLNDKLYDAAFIGLDSNKRAVYDYDKLVNCLTSEDMTGEEAEEYINYNIINLLNGKSNEPIILYRLYTE